MPFDGQEDMQRKHKDAQNAANLGRIVIDQSSGRPVGTLEVPAKAEGQPPQSESQSFKMNLEHDQRNDQRAGQKVP